MNAEQVKEIEALQPGRGVSLPFSEVTALDLSLARLNPNLTAVVNGDLETVTITRRC